MFLKKHPNKHFPPNPQIMHNFTITMDQKNTKKSAEEILCQNAYCSMQPLYYCY